MPHRPSSFALTRVSSHSTRSASLSAASARGDRSPMLPIGVATRCNPGRQFTSRLRLARLPHRQPVGARLWPPAAPPGRAVEMNGTRVNARLIASTLGLLLGLAGCASDRVTPPPEAAQPAEPVKPPEIKVGLLLPLSGPAEAIGRDMLDAAQMALFDVGDNKLVLLPRDTAGTPAGARLAAQEVIREGAEVILGPLLAADVAAVSPIAAQANIRVLAFSNDASVATDGTFLLGFRPEEQVRRVVAYALDSGALVRAEPAPPEQGRPRRTPSSKRCRTRITEPPMPQPPSFDCAPAAHRRPGAGRRLWRDGARGVAPARWSKAAANSARPWSIHPTWGIRRRWCAGSRGTTSGRPRSRPNAHGSPRATTRRRSRCCRRSRRATRLAARRSTRSCWPMAATACARSPRCSPFSTSTRRRRAFSARCAGRPTRGCWPRGHCKAPGSRRRRRTIWSRSRTTSARCSGATPSSLPRSPTTPPRSRWWSRAIWAIAASPPVR